MPSDINNYLKHHFGNWEIPKNDWKPYRDDQAIIHCRLEEFLKGKNVYKLLWRYPLCIYHNRYLSIMINISTGLYEENSILRIELPSERI